MMINRRQFLQASGATLAASQLLACGRELSPMAGIPRSAFDDTSTAIDVTEGINLQGKTAVVTGCTSGIGLETLRVLAKRGAHVIGTSRSVDRAAAVGRKVEGTTSPVALDLGDLDSVVECAETIRAMRRPIDILVCNAGYLGGGDDRQLLNGVEKHFAINHLGHYVLVNRLLDRLFIADQARIVVVASRSAYTRAPKDGILFDDLMFTRSYDDMLAYGHSKLANVLFSLSLSEALKGTRMTSNSLHPGLINTEIDRNLGGGWQFGLKILAAINGKSIAEGAATSCYVATAKSLSNVSGAYFEDCNPVVVGGQNHLYNGEMASKLMQVSAELTSDHIITQTLPTRDNPFNDPK